MADSREPVRPRIRTLDGLRGLAIGLVLWLHLSIGGFVNLDYPPALGRIGVALFFVLSGFLITQILLSEPIQLGRFWMRRALRIFPAFYTYLAVLGLLWAGGVYHLVPTAFFAAATYWMNFYRGFRGWPLEHTWSLAVEEQFYLFWPLVLKLLGPRRTLFAVTIGLALWPLQRYLRTGHWSPSDPYTALYSVTFDAIMWGCLIALWWSRKKDHALAAKSAFGAVGCGLLVIASLWPTHLPTAILVPVRNAGLAAIVLWASCTTQGVFKRLLEWSWLVWLGQRSYSLYLWHMIFLDPRLSHGRWALAWVVVAFLVAELSFRWVESPILRWRDGLFAGPKACRYWQA